MADFIVFTFFGLCFIGYILIPMMKFVGRLLLGFASIVTFVGIIIVFSTPGGALLFLLLVLMGFGRNPNRKSFI